MRFELAFQDDESVYILTEYCAGSTLFSYLQEHYPTGLPEAQARPIFLSLVQAVSFLHLNGVLHRDLKLTNILLTDTLQVRIADFGLATKLEDATIDQEMTMCGTPNYVSPEVVRRDPYGISSDIWSLGCILVALLTGRPPFQGEQISETLQLVSRGAYRPLPRGASRDVKSLVDSILQVDPKRRLSTPAILSHPFLASSMSSHEMERSPLSDTLYGLHSTNNNKPTAYPGNVDMNGLSSLKDMRKVLLRGDIGSPSQVARQPERCAQNHASRFGDTVEVRQNNPWVPQTNYTYQDHVMNMRTPNPVQQEGFRDVDMRTSLQPLDPPERPWNFSNRRRSQSESSHVSEASAGNYRKEKQTVPVYENEIRTYTHGDHEPYNGFENISKHKKHDQIVTYGHADSGDTLNDYHPNMHHQHLRQNSEPYRPTRFTKIDTAIVRPEAEMPRLSNSYPRLSETIVDRRTLDNMTNTKARLTEPYDLKQNLSSRDKDIAPRVVSFEEPQGMLQCRQSDAIRPSNERPLHVIVNDLAEGRANKVQSTSLHHSRKSSSQSSGQMKQSFDIVAKYKFSTMDLKPTTQNTKHAEVAILATGEVSIAIVGESCRYLISSDGENIVSIKQDDSRKHYPLADLPARSLLAYRYASKFVNLVRSKTVKIALDSAIAKCRLYQNDAFEIVLLKEQRKIAFHPGTKIVKVADHHAVLWKGHLADVPQEMRESARQTLIWWERCKDVLNDPHPGGLPKSTSEQLSVTYSNSATSARFTDGQGWCERREDGSLWNFFFLDGTAMELHTDDRLLKLTTTEGIVQNYKMEAGLPEHVRKRLKMASKAMKEFA